MTQNRSRYIYRMSVAGSCSAVLSRYRLGRPIDPAPDWLEDIAKESERHEDWIVEDLLQEGYTVARAGVCKKCYKDSGAENRGIHVEIGHKLFKLIGHMDGIIIPDMNQAHLLELKGLSRFRYLAWLKQRWEGFPMFAAQLTCYFEGSKPLCSPPALFIAKNRDTGEKDNLLVDEPPMNIDEIIEKFIFIEANARAGRLVSCDVEPNSALAKYCRNPSCPHRR